MPRYYPVMLDMRGRQAVVLGGDRVAAEKAVALYASGAHVTVIHPEFCDELLAQSHRIILQCKCYEPCDLAGAFVVIVVATNDPQLIEAVWSETQEHGQLVNIVDVPSRCSFIMPSILRRDQLTIAVSTEGTNPSIAKRIRQRLETLFPSAYGPYLRLAALVRKHLRKRGLSYEQRDTFFGAFFSSDILKHLAEGNDLEALAIAVELLNRYNVDISTTSLMAELRGR